MRKRRPSGDGVVRKREDGRREGRYVVRHSEQSFPATKNVLTKSWAECMAKLEQLLESPQELVNNQPKPGISLRNWLNFWHQWYEKANLRPNT